MKTYEEMAQNALNRISNYKTEKKERRKKLAKISAFAVCFCLAAVLCVSVGQSKIFKSGETLISADNTASQDGNQSLAYNNSDKNSDSAVSYESTTQKASDKSDKASVQNKISSEKSDNTAGTAEHKNVPDDKPKTQAVTGNSNKQKGAENPSGGFRYFWWNNNLLVSGALKSAMENNPDSVFTVLATYRPATADVTSFTYEGKTLSKWAIEAYKENAPQEAIEGYKLAYNAYLETVLPTAVNRLTGNQIRCERTAYRNDALTLFVTAEQLNNLPLDNLKYWHFDLDSDNLKGASNNETNADGFKIVN